tara:strand:+ start:165 stop:824 length:660 start_codon:yes stop_codon:yes gene_type:complete
MFFERQFSQECGLHAIHNLFKSALVTRQEIHTACKAIEAKTGDLTQHHESYSGDWSCSAVLETIRDQGYKVTRAVHSSHQARVWHGEELDELLRDPLFRGMVLYQPFNRHFTCVRTETIDQDPCLYYVDSMARGPIRISPRLVTRRCLSNAYRWEAFVVKGPEMKVVPLMPSPKLPISNYCTPTAKREKFVPSVEFLTAWKSVHPLPAPLPAPLHALNR